MEPEKKTAMSRWTCFGVSVPRTLDYSTINLNPRNSARYDHTFARPSQTDRQMDKHHGSNATIRFNERIAR